ncbi:TPA: hypothetical protein ACLHMH_000062 [Acinetobacter baumannii]
MNKIKNQFRQLSIEFQLSVLSVHHLLSYVTYSFDQMCYVESGTTKDHEFAAVVVNAAWDAWLVQHRKLESKDKLLIQQGQAYNEQSQKVKDLEYKLSLEFTLVPQDVSLVLVRVDYSKFYSSEQARAEIAFIKKHFSKVSKTVVVLDSKYSIETLTDEQQRTKCCGVFHGDIHEIPTEGTFIVPRGEKILDAPKATKVQSSTVTVTVRDIDKTDSTSTEADELRERISKAITR